MSMSFTLPFPLPGDDAFLRAQLRRPGGLAALPDDLRPAWLRAIAGLDLMGIVQLAECAGPGDDGLLYREWLNSHGDDPAACGAWFNLGVALSRAGNPTGAIDAYRAARLLKPDFAEAAINLGTAYEAAGQTDAALATWTAALPPAALRKVLHNQLGRVQEGQGALGPAAENLRASLLIDADQPDVQQHLVHLRQRMTAWPPAALSVPGLTDEQAADHCGPLAALALFDDPARQAAIAADWLTRKVPAMGPPLAPPDGYAHDRIRIGYLSTDFCRHAMSFLIAELLELHDRTRFEVYGYCASPEDGSAIRARVLAALDHHIPIRDLSDEQAAARIRADEIDVLIDLNGLTRGARVGVLRCKPAPVQITYLGYIGPVPLPELDYILCDEVTIPPQVDHLYHPRPLRIAGCYQANDSQVPDLPAVTRASEGLPDDAFVYCCVSHHYKITQPMFAAWCQIIAAVPGAVLWLIDDNACSRAALSQRWQAAGLAADRLIFASRVDPDRYRARLALADLFLDTSPYNAGTIASDALRMGLPLLTLLGQAFAARMAASLLTAIGLPDLIATDLVDYTNRAIDLATNHPRLMAAKTHLANGAWQRSLGNSEDFTRRFETAIKQVRLRPAP